MHFWRINFYVARPLSLLRKGLPDAQHQRGGFLYWELHQDYLRMDKQRSASRCGVTKQAQADLQDFAV
jgi:hypothetical protein